MPSVVLVGTLDTKGAEYAFVRDRLRESGVDVILVDTGVFEPQTQPDVSNEQVAEAGGAKLADLVARRDRGEAVATMGRGAGVILKQLHEQGRLQAAMALGGGGAASLASAAMTPLPLGVPKLIVSTVAAGEVSRYVGTRDFTLMYPVLDISGINHLSATILTNAAAAAAGMARAEPPQMAHRPMIGATMFGVTTPAVTAARDQLDKLGYEPLVFHANGAGGRCLEAMVEDGMLSGVLDLTTTELADEVVGGILSAGPDRLTAAGRHGLPQVVSVGALDMVNFGPMDTVPERFRERNLYAHNAQVTLMRTTPAECEQIGRLLAQKLNAAKGPVALFLPLRGVSMISVEGETFHDPDADAALFQAIRTTLEPHVELTELDLPINDAAFAEAMTDRLHELCRTHGVSV